MLQQKLSACPPNQIMDLYIVVDTASHPLNTKSYDPHENLKMVQFLATAYNKIGKWDTHIGLATWNGNNMIREFHPREFNTRSDPPKVIK